MTEDSKVPEDVFILASGTIAPPQPNQNPIRTVHMTTNLDTGAITVLDIKRRINVGDMVLMEYAKDIVETVKVEAIEDGMVYATGEDGEDFCAPLDNCDKVPF